MRHQDKKLIVQVIKAACGHEYRASILYTEEQELREQRAILVKFDCLDCIDNRREHQTENQPNEPQQ